MLEEHKSNLLQVAPAEDWRLASAPRNGGSGPTVDFWLGQESHGILSPQPEARGFTVTREKGGVVRVTLAVKTLSRSEIEVFRHDSQLRERQDNIHIHLRVEGL